MSNAAAIKLIDTSVLINSGFLEYIKKGFLEGQIIVPSFVVREFQTMADATSSKVRKKGKLALDNLAKLGELPTVVIEDMNRSDEGELDELIMSRAKLMS